jgi:hypothetical protein
MSDVQSTEEVWKDCPGHPGYQVSSLGRVRSFRVPRSTNKTSQLPRVLAQLALGSKGNKYPAVTLGRLSGRCPAYRIHNLVLLAFVGPRPSGMEACHGDGNPWNNALSNLRWDTRTANVADAKRHGTRGKRTSSSGVTPP